jgi:hypothetical protein
MNDTHEGSEQVNDPTTEHEPDKDCYTLEDDKCGEAV